jgi:ubiquinone/menaquinone biosynthesis C-methylase UbiE
VDEAFMSVTDNVFTGSIPALYDQYLGSLLFQPYASDIAGRLTDLTGGRLLETAAGTGIVTRALAAALFDQVQIVATDLNQPMLDHAATHLSSSRVTWQQADALNLPFEDALFDRVVCQFGIMFVPDKLKAYQEALRVLKPGGSFIFNVWDKIEENEFARLVAEAVKALFPQNPPMFLGRTPYGYHNQETIRDELLKTGFSGVKSETIVCRSRASSPSHPAIGYCQGTPLRGEIEARGVSCLQEATDAATEAIASRFGIGAVDGKIQAHVIVAYR